MIAITTAVAQKPNQDARKLSMALYAISNLYVDPVDDSKLVEDAIIGMLEKLNYIQTIWIRKRQRDDRTFARQLRRYRYQFNMLTDTLYVIQVIPGGPSERSA